MNDLEQMAIDRLKAASDMSLMAYQQPLVICISGGKDSGVITELAVRSGIPCEFQHNHTTADAPETVRFVRNEFKRLEENGYKGLAWGLSYEDVERLIQQPCFYCGTINSNHKVTKNCKEGYDHNGIDRTDSSRGYFIDNVVPCCKICNRAKNNMDQREFIEWARKVTNHTVCLPMAEQWGALPCE